MKQVTIYKPGNRQVSVTFTDSARMADIKKVPQFEVGDKMDVELADGRLYAYKKFLAARYCRRCGFVHKSRIRVIPIRLSGKEAPYEYSGEVSEWECPNPLCEERGDWCTEFEPQRADFRYTSEVPGMGKHPHFMDEDDRPVSCRDRYVGILDDSTPGRLREQLKSVVISAFEWSVFQGPDADLADDPWKTTLDLAFWPPVTDRFPELGRFLELSAARMGVDGPEVGEVTRIVETIRGM